MAENAKIVCQSHSYSDESEDENNGSEEELGFSLEKLNIGPKKKLIVLGFGGLLCYRIFRYDKHNVPISRDHDSAYGNYIVYKRPHLEEFMKLCLERFEVGIWSSATEYNLNSCIGCTMEGLKSKLLFAWGQEKSTHTGFGTLENKNRPIFVKELKKIWEDNNSLIPLCDQKFSSSNTLLIDGKPYTSLLNPVHNAIFPKQYNVDDEDEVLGPGSELRRFLDNLVDAKDVPSYVMENPIGQMAIAQSHSDWNYYSKIVRQFQTTSANEN